MATAEARICNRALLRCGQQQGIESLDQASGLARSCKLIYADSRDATLEARDWPFARRRKVLSAMTDGARGSWAFAYPLPPDCIAPRFIDLGAGDESEPVPFELEDDATSGPIILCDLEAPELVYTARIESVPRFTANFIEALSFRLAADLAMGVMKKPSLGVTMMQGFEHALARAASTAGRHRKPRKRPASIFERVRGAIAKDE